MANADSNHGLEAVDIASIQHVVANRMLHDDVVSIAVLDIDHFTNINLKIGEGAGDEILKRLIAYIRQNENLEIKRYGGDEFALIFSNRDETELFLQIDQLRKRIRKQKFFDPTSKYSNVPISVSIGIAHTSQSDSKLQTLLKSAEIALGMAKKQGRNRVVSAPKSGLTIYDDPSFEVCTVTGGFLRGFSGDGGRAFNAQILEPYGVDLTWDRDLLVADRGNHRIRAINDDGTIRTVAGSNDYGYSGDSQLATLATLNKPSGIAVDHHNQIFIADTGNHCIRKIAANGIIHTFAGCGRDGYSGDGGPAIQSTLSRPGGVVADWKGCIYTNDYGNNVIRKIDQNGIISTIAGSGEYGYSGDGGHPKDAAIDRPYGLAVTRDGEMLYIADYGNHCVREVDMTAGRIRTVCGSGNPGYSGDGGDAGKAELNGPFWIYPWSRRYILIADAENHCIRIVNLKTRIIETLIGNGQPGYVDSCISDSSTLLNLPAGLIIDHRKKILYIADYGNNAIRRVVFNELPC